MPKTKKFFLHIPKSAGSSLNGMFRESFGMRFRHLSFEEGQLLSLGFSARGIIKGLGRSVLSGHAYYGVHEGLLGNVDYVTFLRHPVARISSHYHFVSEQTGHYLHSAVSKKSMDLVSYARSELSPELDNGQVRVLANYRGEEAVAKKHLEQAIQNLKRFWFVGLQENFVDDTRSLFSQLGRPCPKMVRANITKSRRPPDELAIEAINERNKYDVELWEYVARLKDEAVVVEK